VLEGLRGEGVSWILRPRRHATRSREEGQCGAEEGVEGAGVYRAHGGPGGGNRQRRASVVRVAAEVGARRDRQVDADPEGRRDERQLTVARHHAAADRRAMPLLTAGWARGAMCVRFTASWRTMLRYCRRPPSSCRPPCRRT